MVSKTRIAIESLYKDKCDVYVVENVTDPATNITKQDEKCILSDQPCRLSFLSSPSADQKEAAVLSQTVKLFIAPEINIAPGSKIVITKENGIVYKYKNSGLPASYVNHQEITLETWEGWA